MSVTVSAEPWQLYGGGLFTGCSKSGLFGGDNTLDHGVQAVGYTADYCAPRRALSPLPVSPPDATPQGRPPSRPRTRGR